ncbi:2TM domain-containing protein [Variovorax sp. dw_954]|uniref:2TM domain-containing protein n=1 Tax=Variovorax sp. dw_954 TaxID=2720078 RepID=UPI001BD2CC71|nr:2TM domain-containing protein [Variovorax sp. dw_954]
MQATTLPLNDEARLDKLARRRARAKLAFFSHAAIYTAVNAGLIALSLAGGRHWAVFPLLGWGIGLLAHGLSVYVFAPGGNMMESMVQRERARLVSKAEPW